jgi:biotin transport system substrate-specific component
MTAITHPAAADLCRPARRAPGIAYELALIAAGSALIALSAWVSVRLPFSPVPITGQTFAVLLVGALYGARRGVATVVAYLAEGALGLPVFAGGAAGAAWMLGPTGGYLLGFVLAAGIVGWLAERGWDRRPALTALAMTFGTLAIFLPGLLWLGRFVGFDAVLATGFVPYLPGAVVKIALATVLLPVGWRVLRRT